MLFTILLVLSVIAIILAVLSAAYCTSKDPEVFPFIGILAVICCVPFVLPTAATWTSHANDLGKIVAYHKVIVVYQDRVDSLNARLDATEYTPNVLVNADTPVAAMVEALTRAEADLAEAKASLALAYVSIERRRAGPFSDVIEFVGDYK